MAALSSREEDLVAESLSKKDAPKGPLCHKAAAWVALAAAQTPEAAVRERYLGALAASVLNRWE